MGSTNPKSHCSITFALGAIGLLISWSLAAPVQAKSRLGVQIATDFSQHFNFSARDPRQGGTPGVFERLIYRDLGFSWRPRLSIRLMERHDRPLELLIGAYVRNPVIMWFTGYGSSIQGPVGLEFGGDLGVGWFGFARTLVTFSPLYALTYTTTDFGSSATFTANHWSVGIRLEVPILFLESDPGDMRVEFGPMATYAADAISSIEIHSDSDSSLNQTFSNTQAVEYRWLLGVYMSVRI